MANFALSVTLGAGETGAKWDQVVRQQAKKRRMSLGAFVRYCIQQQILRETGQNPDKPAAAPAPAAQPAPATQPTQGV